MALRFKIQGGTTAGKKEIRMSSQLEEAQMNDDRLALYKRAQLMWGGLQLIVVIEELSELVKAISKYVRGEKNLDLVAEEIADVEIMLEQSMVWLESEGYDTTKIDEFKSIKLRRLRKKLDSDEGANDVSELQNVGRHGFSSSQSEGTRN